MKRALKIIGIIIGTPILVLAVLGLFSRDTITIPEGFSGTYVEVAGEKIRYVQKGEGLDVLLIHGLPGSIEDWDPVLEPLAARYRVTAYDRPGQGFSSARNCTYDFQSNAEVALALIDTLKLRDVIVVGHSYGGGTSLAMAIRNPKTVKAFISIAGVSDKHGAPEGIYYINQIPLIGRGFAVLGSSLIGEDMIKEGIKEAFRPNESSMTEEYVNTRLKIWLQTKVIMTIAHESINMNESTSRMRTKFRDITAPLYLIHGDSDLLVPLKHSVDLQKKVAKSRIMVLEKTGHQVQFVNPGAVISAIDALARE